MISPNVIKKIFLVIATLAYVANASSDLGAEMIDATLSINHQSDGTGTEDNISTFNRLLESGKKWFGTAATDNNDADMDGAETTQTRRRLGSWRTYKCTGGGGAVRDDDYPAAYFGSPGSVLSSSDAFNIGIMICCPNGDNDGFQTKSYKTIFGTKDWKWRCIAIEDEE